MSRRPHLVLVGPVLAVRMVQLAGIRNGYMPPVEALTPLPLTSTEVSGFLLAPLFVYLLLARIDKIYHPYMLVRTNAMPRAAIEHAKAALFDSFAITAVTQVSGLCVVRLTHVPFDGHQLVLYLVVASAILFLHYMVAGCLLLLCSLLLRGIVLPIIITMLVLCWDSFAWYVTILIQNDVYLGWRLVEGLLGPQPQQYVVAGLRVALCPHWNVLARRPPPTRLPAP